MSIGAEISLAEGERLAAAIVERLRPECHRIEVAGSVRRRRGLVSDLDLIAIPRVEHRAVAGAGAQQNLFSAPPTAPVNCVWDLLEELRVAGEIAPLAMGVVAALAPPDPHWGKKRTGVEDRRSRLLRFRHLASGLPVELYLPTVETWGAAMAIRTGSADFAQGLVMRFTSHRGGRFVENRLVVDGMTLVTREEDDVFRECGVAMVDPWWRSSAKDLRFLPPRRRGIAA